MRIYKNITFDKDRETIRLMQLLTEPDVSVEDYRHAFYRLGRELGLLLNEKAGGNYGNTMLACASEDADWLVRGVLDVLSSDKVSLAVFWNERMMLDPKTHLEYSPIVKSYVEPVEECRTLVLVKSIVSTSCVVKTQLTRLMTDIQPQKVYIVAPVMYKDAARNLKEEFPSALAEKFEFITFAVDTERDEQHGVIPGIGGMVYPRLGLGDVHDKNRYMPELVKSRMPL